MGQILPEVPLCSKKKKKKEQPLTTFIEHLPAAITELMREQGIERSVDLRKRPELCIEGASTHGLISQNSNLTLYHLYFTEHIIIIHFSF